MNARIARILLLPLLLLAVAGTRAGGGPETTLLVVNADSAISLAVANHYIQLRQLPEQQVLWLRDIPVGDIIGIDDFRRHILDPIRNHFIATGLGERTELIAYSAGFPYGVDFSADLERAGREPNKRVGTVGALTGLTYFMHRVAAMDLGYLQPRANQYFRHPRQNARGDGIGFDTPRAFQSRHPWQQGHPHPGGSSLDRYYLSVMLGYDGERGNSLPEMRAYLARAAAADGTRPEGTVYLMENRNIRSRVRQPLFPVLVETLQAQGRRVEVIAQGDPGQDGRIPHNRTDIIGLVAGTRLFDWPASGSQLLPGAIAEAFTSYGGHFSHGAQTKLTEFLRHGAAGSSGAVQEPYSFVEKFPVPQLHAYYAAGSSLAEAFYQSVFSPYQLIVVGDPLARPFARFARLDLAPDPEQSWSGLVQLRPRVRMPPGEDIEHIELWLNGRPVGRARAHEPLALDTRKLPDGMHELRLVAVAAGAMATRSAGAWPIRVDNQGLAVTLRSEATALPHGGEFALAGTAPGATSVQIHQGLRRLATAPVQEGHWQARLPARMLGEGTSRIRAEAIHGDGRLARSVPLVLEVLPPDTAPGQSATDREPGLRAEIQAADEQVHFIVLQGLDGGIGPREWRSLRPVATRYMGVFETRAAGLHELTLVATGQVRVSVGGEVRFEGTLPPAPGGTRLALALGKGWHSFEIRIQDVDRHAFPRVTLAGPETPFLLAGERVRH